MHKKIGVIVALLAGLVIAAFVVAQVGIGPVLDAVARAGLGGLVLIVLAGLFGVVSILGTAFFVLIPGEARWPLFVAARQLRDSASDILPFTQIGGIVIGARAIILGGAKPARAYGAMMVDVTTELMAQIAFILLGLMLGLARLKASAATAPYADGLILAMAVLIPGVIAFVVLQRRGSALAEKIAGRFLPSAVRSTEEFSRTLKDLYGQPWRIASSSTLHLTGWIASGVWLWLVIRLAGGRCDVFSAIAIESLLGGLRSATVFIPSSIGVQEAGYAALAPVFGMGAEVGLAVSLLKRARDIVVGVPVLLAWQLVEGKRAFGQPRSVP